MKNNIWFEQPANIWEEVIPIGNGSLGAMIWGTVQKERVGLNLDTLWSGYARDKNNYNSLHSLAAVRDCIFNQKYVEAAKQVEANLLGEFTETYLPMGDLWIESSCQTKSISEYIRELDLNHSLSRVTYIDNSILFQREYFASYPDNAIIIRLKSGKPCDYTLSFESQLQHSILPTYNFFEQINGLCVSGQCPEHVAPSYLVSDTPIIQGAQGLRFKTVIYVPHSDGTIHYSDSTLHISNSTETLLIIQAASETRERRKIPFQKQLTDSYDNLFERHIGDYQSLYKKVDIYLGDAPSLPIDKRLDALSQKDDPALFALFFQYGRYLLISSSREGSEAATLQGIWNWEMRPPWSSNYTTNINIQMNYWPAQVCNLKECLAPYYQLLSELVENGKKTAKIHFDCNGFCVGHNSDYWRSTNPVGVPFGKDSGVEGSSLYAFFILSGQWMCQELWKAYEYQSDLSFLTDYAFPILRESTLFVLSWLVEHNGYYVTVPSTSPENQFQTKEGPAAISYGTTIDRTIVAETFDHYKKMYFTLKNTNTLSKCHNDTAMTDDEILQLVLEKESLLPPYPIGDDGRLQEWILPFDEIELGHRHISHAYGLFPGNEFQKNMILKDACEKSILYRLSHGGGHTGWSCAWIANFFAVLEDKDRAYYYMHHLLTHSTCNNLWTTHPPFQIDANFSGIMAMANMFVQELNGELKVLPALPSQWDKGHITGLSLTNNRTIDIYWDKNDVNYTIHDTLDK